ncbi:hypothetical protein JCM33374_g2317 [Metschnikowia sp. JCM 33374]|nr:hypothetical protein JCM33374_g2317 [Metschnikowia sp. JCM 33374]
MSRSESTATTKPSTVSPEPRAKHKNKTAQCYRFDADIGSVRDWPSRAVAWLAMMEEHVRARDDIFSDRLKYDFYVSRLGYGPSTRLSWARKSGRVKDLRTFLDWFKERYIDFVDKTASVCATRTSAKPPPCSNISWILTACTEQTASSCRSTAWWAFSAKTSATVAWHCGSRRTVTRGWISRIL